MMLAIIYFVSFTILLLAYIVYYIKLHKKLLNIIENQSAKDFDLFASIHSLLFMIYSVFYLIYDVVFLVLFLNRYGTHWLLILIVAMICIPFLLIITYTGFCQKRIVLKKYNSAYGIDLAFYGQIRYISIFRHTCIISIAFLSIIIFSMI